MLKQLRKEKVALQWFPGHMHKALKEIKESIGSVDVLIEVLDARIPYSSENPEIAAIRGNTPCLKILNKYDLADPVVSAHWQEFLERERGVNTMTTTTDEPANSKQILNKLREICAHKAKSPKSINAMITGIPNVGKSTLINILAERTIAKTGNEPAVTKSQQRIRLDQGIVLLDTPGVLWPKLENPNSIYRLAASGAVKNTAMEYDDVGFYAADYLIKAYPSLLQARFKLDDVPTTEIEFLEAAAHKRGAIMSGGRVNLNRICEILLKELQAGTLGRISLETPEMISAEKRQMADIAAKKAADKAKRKQKFKQGSMTPDKKDRKETREQKRQQQSQSMKKRPK